MNHLLLSAITLATACGAAPTAQERSLTRLFADARGDEAVFVAHFDPRMSRESVLGLRTSFAKESTPKFEEEHGPVCVRAYWGEYVIDHAYYFYLRAVHDGFVITDVEYDSGFGPAVAQLGVIEHHHDPSPSGLAKCKAANAAIRR